MTVLLVGLDRYLWWMLAAGLAALGLVFVVCFVARIVETVRARRRRQLEERYRPIVDALCDPSTSMGAHQALARSPRRHRSILAKLLVPKLHLVSGMIVHELGRAAAAIGLDLRWRRAAASRKWWERAEGAAGLGLLRSPGATPALVALLDDRHEQVRAAAVTALGWLADPYAIEPLLARLADETRYQRVRIVEALQHFGPEVTEPLLTFAAGHAELAPIVADLIGHLRLTSAVDHLIAWTEHADPAVRAAAWRALGTMSLDERAFYYALRALGDDSAQVRAMAARSLGRSSRADASLYLEPCLDDDWEVAAQAAMALRRLGPEGRLVLERAKSRGGFAGDLAGQVLWNAGTSAVGGSPA